MSIKIGDSSIMKLSDFQTIRDLGAGSFGSVKLVRKRDDSQMLAMKTVTLNRLSQKEKDNALNEVRLLASIQIPYVIGYKGSLFDPDTNSLCILMEYADGGDLQGAIQKMRQQGKNVGFEEKYVWKVAYQILQGLKQLHANKIIHRDIKSGNVFIVGGIAKLGDLNVSKVAQQGLCQTQTGTPYYTSPQIWQGRKYGSKCDIWSLGVLLYELCSMQMPFTARDFPSLYRKVCDGSYDELSQQYSIQLRNLIRMCLVVEEQMRPSASQLLQTAVLAGMQASLISEQGEIKLIDPIKCPRVLRFLAVKLPKCRSQEQKKVTFEPKQQPSSKIKSIRKIRSEKQINFQQQSQSRQPILEPLKSPKSSKTIEGQQDRKLERVGSKKNIKLPPLQNESRNLPPIGNYDLQKKPGEFQKKSLKHIPSSRKLILSSKQIPLDKEN